MLLCVEYCVVKDSLSLLSVIIYWFYQFLLLFILWGLLLFTPKVTWYVCFPVFLILPLLLFLLDLMLVVPYIFLPLLEFHLFWRLYWLLEVVYFLLQFWVDFDPMLYLEETLLFLSLLLVLCVYVLVLDGNRDIAIILVPLLLFMFWFLFLFLFLLLSLLLELALCLWFPFFLSALVGSYYFCWNFWKNCFDF